VKKSAIPWCRHSLNFWQGCTEVSRECAGCYARTLILHLKQSEVRKPPDFTETDRVFDSGEPCRCKFDFITEQRLSFGTFTGSVFVGLKGTLSFLRLPDEGLPQDGKTCAPQAVISLTIEAEILPTLPPQESVGGPEEQGAEASPKAEELGRLLERRRAAELGHELPLHASEAADYVGISPAALEQLVSSAEIPSHPQLDLGEDARLFYASELDEWLAAHVEPITKGASQDSDRPERGPEDEKR
jgi:Protein of unknown function (DUF5131)